jgi:hypothetical protein
MMASLWQPHHRLRLVVHAITSPRPRMIPTQRSMSASKRCFPRSISISTQPFSQILSDVEYGQIGVRIGHRCKIRFWLATICGVHDDASDAEFITAACNLANDLLSGRHLRSIEQSHGGPNHVACMQLWRDLRIYARLQNPAVTAYQCILGCCSDFGRGGVVVDKALAAEYYRRAIDGDPAQVRPLVIVH